MLNTAMHFLSGKNGYQFYSDMQLLVPEGTKRISKVNSLLSFLPSVSQSPFPNQLISFQNIFVMLTLTVKAILILNKTMLARPEFLLKQITQNALTSNFVALDSTAFAAHHV